MFQNQGPPFIKPAVPFSWKLKEGLQNGMIITVCGKVLKNADRFHVNLQHGFDVVVLQVNPRYQILGFDSGYVVHNTRKNGAWGWEEHKYETPFPREKMFFLQILVTEKSYKILANVKPFSEYKHRIPVSEVNRICVEGKVELSFVSLHYHKSNHTGLPECLAVPYKTIIHGGMQPGKCIIIQGSINQHAKRVVFSLRHRTGIAFEYSLCFAENVAVCNSYDDGKWGNGDHSGLKQFKRGQTFQVTLCCSPDNYEVFVDDKSTHTYSHHYTNLEEIDVLEVSGDVQLSFVQP